MGYHTFLWEGSVSQLTVCWAPPLLVTVAMPGESGGHVDMDVNAEVKAATPKQKPIVIITKSVRYQKNIIILGSLNINSLNVYFLFLRINFSSCTSQERTE